jgi:fibronectin type 3 domain-containing protein
VLQPKQTRLQRTTSFAFCLLPFAFCLFFSGCGKVGAPIPPIRLTERARDLAAIQRGAKILLSWSAPALGNKESSSSYIERVDIYRLIEKPNQEPVLDEDDYETEAKPVGSMDRATIEAQIQTLGNLQFSDMINLEQATANVRLRYAVRYVNKRGQQAAFSNSVAIEPVALIAASPTNLKIANQQQDAITLSWNAPESGTDGSSSATVVGYNLYRARANRRASAKPLNEEPITELQFTDRTFQYKTEYIYFVRALSQAANGLIESADSDALPITPTDTYAPAAPDSVSAASANGVISLFWSTSTSTDVIGYNVYRAESEDAAEWQKLTPQPSTAVTFRDERVVIDKQYFYRVTSVDKFKNESQPSKIVSETAHP